MQTFLSFKTWYLSYSKLVGTPCSNTFYLGHRVATSKKPSEKQSRENMHPIIFSKNKTIVTVFTTFGQSSKCSRSSFRSIYQFEFSTLWNRISAWIFFFTHLHTCETSIWWIFIPIFYKLCTALNITRFLLRSLSLINVNVILTSSLTSTI